MLNKRGQNRSLAIVFGVIMLSFIIPLIVLTITNGGNFEEAFDRVSNFAFNQLGPIFTTLLGTAKDSNTQFLMVLTFILILIIVVGTLDSVNIFGETGQGHLINLVIGIIASLIGVRFMPSDIWGTLTAPSSAFVATILVGLPFFALFFITMKIRYSLFTKLLWLFYVIFMSYLIFYPTEAASGSRFEDFGYIYVIFLCLAGGMMFFDSTVRRFIYSENAKVKLQDVMHKKGILYRKKLRDEMKRWQAVMLDPDASVEEKNEARKMLAQLGDLNREAAKQ